MQDRVVYIKINHKNTALCNLLLKHNIIFGYRVVSSGGFKTYEVIIQKGCKFFDLKNFVKVKKCRTIKYKDAIALCNRHTHTCYVFMTSKGIVTLPEMIELKLGGILMFRLK